MNNRLGFALLNIQFCKLQRDVRCGCQWPGELVLRVLLLQVRPPLAFPQPLPLQQASARDSLEPGNADLV